MKRRSIGAEAVMDESWATAWLDDGIFPYWPVAVRIGDLDDFRAWLALQDEERAALVATHAQEFEKVYRLITAELARTTDDGGGGGGWATACGHKVASDVAAKIVNSARHDRSVGAATTPSSLSGEPLTVHLQLNLEDARDDNKNEGEIVEGRPRDVAASSARPLSVNGTSGIRAPARSASSSPHRSLGSGARATIMVPVGTGGMLSWPPPSCSRRVRSQNDFPLGDAQVGSVATASSSSSASIVGASFGSLGARPVPGATTSTTGVRRRENCDYSYPHPVSSTVPEPTKYTGKTRRRRRAEQSMRRETAGAGRMALSAVRTPPPPAETVQHTAFGRVKRGCEPPPQSAVTRWETAEGVSRSLPLAPDASAGWGQTRENIASTHDGGCSGDGDGNNGGGGGGIFVSSSVLASQRSDPMMLEKSFLSLQDFIPPFAPPRDDDDEINNNNNNNNNNRLKEQKHRFSSITASVSLPLPPRTPQGSVAIPSSSSTPDFDGNWGQATEEANVEEEEEEEEEEDDDDDDIDDSTREEGVEQENIPQDDNWLRMRDPVSQRDFWFDPKTRAAEWDGGEAMMSTPGGMGLGLLSEEMRKRLKLKFERRQRRRRRKGSRVGAHQSGGLREQVLRKLTLEGTGSDGVRAGISRS